MWKIKKGYNPVSKSFRLPEELVKKIDNLAHNNNLSLNQLVIQCLNYAVNNLDNTTENKESDGNDREKSREMQEKATPAK